MGGFSRLQRAEGSMPALLCRNRAEIVAALAAVREFQGVTQYELDLRAGFEQGYVGKLERPDTIAVPGKQKPGRWAVNLMFDYWIGALKVGLLIVPLDQETSAAPLPPLHKGHVVRLRPPKVTLKTANRIRRLFATQRYSRPMLAGKFGLPLNMICDIVENRTHNAPVDRPRVAA